MKKTLRYGPIMMWQICGKSHENSPFLTKVTSNKQQANVNKKFFKFYWLDTFRVVCFCSVFSSEKCVL